MIKTAQKREILERLLRSAVFWRSDTYRKLLTYLVQKSIEGQVPSEIDIATDVLGRDKSFNPTEDTLVRVHIYKLRKKLEEYYNNEGKEEKIRLTIPKGSYHVVYEPWENESEQTKLSAGGNITKLRNLIVLGFVFIVVFQLYLFWRLSQNSGKSSKISSDDPFWSSLLSSSKPTAMVIGNTFTFTEMRPDINSFRLVHDLKINSEPEFREFLNRPEISDELYAPSTWDVIPKSGLINFATIQPIFIEYKKSLIPKTSDEIVWEELKQYNFFYVGHFENLQLLRKVLPAKQYEFVVMPNEKGAVVRGLRYHDDQQDTVYRFIDPEITRDSFVRDYVVVAKVAGPEENIFFFIISFHHIGRLEVIKTLVSRDELHTLMEQIREHLGKIPDFFEMILEVEGFEASALSTNLKHVYELSSIFSIRDE